MLTLSAGAGVGGEIKKEPEDFVVMEITSKGVMLEPRRAYSSSELSEPESPEGKFTTFVIEKRDWDTIRAITEVARRVGRGRKSVSYAGTKDKRAVTVQLASIYGADPSAVSSVKIKDISINAAWKSDGIELGSNLGNGFTVRIRGAESTDRIGSITTELNGRFPNYFDRQRFGYRLNNARIGLHMMRGNFEDAVMAFLTDTSNETDQESSAARERLLAERDFGKALSYFPRHLRHERTVIEYMSRYGNFANSLRKLPRGISLMFAHSVENLIFNKALEDRIRAKDLESAVTCGRNPYGFPDTARRVSRAEDGFPAAALVGYETDDADISEYERRIMQALGVEKEMFRMRGMPELGMKGHVRALLAPVKGFSCAVEGSDVTASFSLPSGSYATIFLNELTKAGSLDLREAMPQTAEAP